MTQYRVVWEIDIDAETPDDAAEAALLVQRDPDSIATFFTVEDLETGERASIDLNDAFGS